jgi:hypothetical protein
MNMLKNFAQICVALLSTLAVYNAHASGSVSCMQIVSSEPVYGFSYKQAQGTFPGTLSANWATLGTLSCQVAKSGIACRDQGKGYTVTVSQNGIADVSLNGNHVMTLSCANLN